MFRDRADAGRQLLERLRHLNLNPAETVVIALPRGGVPVAAPIAEDLGAPLDLAIVRKVGLPGNKEVALGAVSDGGKPQLFVNDRVARFARLSRDEIWKLAQPEIAEAERRRARYLKGRQPLPVAGRTVIVVDDGIATGATLRAALGMLKTRRPARIVVAVPVAPEDVVASLSGLVDDVICVETPQPFQAVGLHYSDFTQVPDADVAKALSGSDAPQL